MTPPQRAGLRATTIHDLNPLHHPEWCTPRTIAMHRRKDAGRGAKACDVVFTNSRYTADGRGSGRSGSRPSAWSSPYPGVGGEFVPEGERATFGGEPYVLGVGTLEPAQEPPAPRRCVAPARGRGAARARRRIRLGRATRARRRGMHAARVRPRRRVALPLPWSSGVRLSVAVRGLRHARASRRWRVAPRSSSPNHRSLDEAWRIGRRSRRPGRSRRHRGRDGGGRTPGRGSFPPGSSMPRPSPGRGRVRIDARGTTSGGSRRETSGSSVRARPDGRRHRAPRAGPARGAQGQAGARRPQAQRSAARGGCDRGAGRGVVPVRPSRAPRANSTSCIARRCASRSGRARPLSRPSTT